MSSKSSVVKNQAVVHFLIQSLLYARSWRAKMDSTFSHSPSFGVMPAPPSATGFVISWYMILSRSASYKGSASRASRVSLGGAAARTPWIQSRTLYHVSVTRTHVVEINDTCLDLYTSPNKCSSDATLVKRRTECFSPLRTSVCSPTEASA